MLTFFSGRALVHPGGHAFIGQGMNSSINQFAGPITFSYTPRGLPSLSSLNFTSYLPISKAPLLMRSFRRMRQPVQQQHLVLERAFAFPIDDGLCLGIGEAATRAHHRTAEPLSFDPGLVVQFEKMALKLSLSRIGVQGTEVVAELLWKHGHHTVGLGTRW